MPSITWDDKVDGGQFTAADANQVKSVVNSKADQTSTQAAIDEINEVVGGLSAATPFGLSLLDDADAAAGRATLELGNVNNTSDANKPISTATAAALALKANASAVSNVDNTSDANKPVSDAVATALGLKANIASPAFTGNPTATTQTAGNSSTRIATTAFVQGELADYVAIADLGDEIGALAPGDGVMTIEDGAFAVSPLQASDNNTVFDYNIGASGLTNTAALMAAVRTLRAITKTVEGSTDVVTFGLATAASPALSNNAYASIAQAVELVTPTPEAAVKLPITSLLRLDNATATARAVTLAVAETGTIAQEWIGDSESLASVPVSSGLFLARTIMPTSGANGAPKAYWSFVRAV